jgi:hypothetical protein
MGADYGLTTTLAEEQSSGSLFDVRMSNLTLDRAVTIGSRQTVDLGQCACEGEMPGMIGPVSWDRSQGIRHDRDRQTPGGHR